MKKFIVFFILIFLLFSLISTWGLFWKKNKKHDSVTIYTTLDEPVAVKVFKQFTKDTGIKANWVRLSTGECQARLEAEKENPQASVWFGGVGILHIMAKNKGLTIPYKSYNAKNIPDGFKDKDGYWTGMYAGMLCFESNTDMLKKFNLTAPTSWEEICSSKYKGHVQMANPGSSGTSYNVLATLVQIFGEDRAFDLLKNLDNNIVQYTRSGSAPGRNASIGEVTIAIGYSHDAVQLVNQGYPLQITFPKEGTGYEVASVSMIKNGPKKEVKNAEALIDWGLSKSCAKVFASMSLVPFINVPLVKGAVSISKINTIKQDDEWAAKERKRLVEKWNQVVGGGAKTKN